VRLLARDAPLSAQAVANIVDRTDGIPLYIEEITRAVVESEQWQPIRAAATRGDGLLPMWLETSLLARLDRLGDTREVAETAAAIGRRFSVELLRRVVRQPDRLAEALDALRAAGIVQAVGLSDTEFVFRHALIRDAAYHILVKERRQEIHCRIAAAIGSHFPEIVANQPDEVAMHCAEAGLAREAASHWLKAGHAALRRSAMHEALIHLRRGIDVLPAGNTEPWRLALELDLTIALGKAQTATQGYAMPSTGQTFARARELCVHSDKPALVLAVAHGLWTHALMRAELDTARAQADELREQGLRSGSRMQQMMGNCFSGVTRHPLGEFADAVSLLETGLEQCDSAQQAVHAALTIDDPRVVMLTYMSWSQMCLGRIADALRSSKLALAEAREMGHAYTLAHALVGASFVALTVVTPELALQRLDELRALLADNPIDYYDAVETLMRGWCLAAIGQFESSHRHLDSGLAAYRATESRLYLSGFLRMAAEAHGWAGRLAGAFELIDESLRVLDATGQRWDEAEAHRVRGALLRSAGDLDGARGEFERARELAQARRSRLWALRAANDLAELAAGRGSGAAELRWLAKVVDAYEPGAGTPDLARARALLSHQGAGR
jgi:predicted ATPase